MKKLATVLILLVYFTVSTGFIVSVHFCMSKISSTSIGAKTDKYCDRCGMETDGACCWDEVKVFKLKVEHPVSKALAADFSGMLPESPATALLRSETAAVSPKIFIPEIPPPDGREIHVLNCVYRI